MPPLFSQSFKYSEQTFSEHSVAIGSLYDTILIRYAHAQNGARHVQTQLRPQLDMIDRACMHAVIDVNDCSISSSSYSDSQPVAERDQVSAT